MVATDKKKVAAAPASSEENKKKTAKKIDATEEQPIVKTDEPNNKKKKSKKGQQPSLAEKLMAKLQGDVQRFTKNNNSEENDTTNDANEKKKRTLTKAERNARREQRLIKFARKEVQAAGEESEEDLDILSSDDEDYKGYREKKYTKEELEKFKLTDEQIAEKQAKIDKENEGKIYLRQKDEPKVSTQGGAIVYLGRLPHGFYEDGIRKYFKQFGKIIKVRVCRNPKTFKSRHYALIHFANLEVAHIAANAMNNYLMDNHILKCKVTDIPVERAVKIFKKPQFRLLRPHQELFRVRDYHDKIRSKRFAKIFANKETLVRTHANTLPYAAKIIKKKQMKEQMKNNKLKKLGIDYQFNAYADIKAIGKYLGPEALLDTTTEKKPAEQKDETKAQEATTTTTTITTTTDAATNNNKKKKKKKTSKEAPTQPPAAETAPAPAPVQKENKKKREAPKDEEEGAAKPQKRKKARKTSA